VYEGESQEIFTIIFLLIFSIYVIPYQGMSHKGIPFAIIRPVTRLGDREDEKKYFFCADARGTVYTCRVQL